jgi:PAS domain S-box-containing protein
VGSWEWDIINETMWWSGEMCRMFGLTAAPGTYDGFLTFVHPDDRARVAANIRIVDRIPRHFSLDYRIIKANGETRVLHGEGRVEVDLFGRLSRIIGVCHDISDRKKAEEERAQLLAEQARRREFEEIDRAKDTFLATLSHELRTPLNVALGWAATLRDSPELANLQRTRAIDAIYRNLMLQWRLVSDILDLSQIVKGTLVLDSKPVDLSRVFEAAIEMLRETARVRSVAFDIRMSGASIVMGDSRRLEQVAWNLVSNAVKFAAANGCVIVSVRESQDMVECTVEDDGGGISEAFLPHIFERFRQADREHGGLGLGMAIAHDIVTMHHGTISAGNRVPHGAVFVVRLPGYRALRTTLAAVGPRSDGNHNEQLTDE